MAVFGNLRPSFRASGWIGGMYDTACSWSYLHLWLNQGHHASVAVPETELQLYISLVFFVWYVRCLFIKIKKKRKKTPSHPKIRLHCLCFTSYFWAKNKNGNGINLWYFALLCDILKFTPVLATRWFFLAPSLWPVIVPDMPIRN